MLETSLVNTAARFCRGVRMHEVKAVDFQRPSVCIVESLRPTSDTVVAAPIRKLWPLKHFVLIPEASRAWCKACTSRCRESVDPLSKIKRGPVVGGGGGGGWGWGGGGGGGGEGGGGGGGGGRLARYDNIDVTG